MGGFLSMSLRFHHNSVGLGVSKAHATIGVEQLLMGEAPSGEGVRVNVGFDDDVSLANISLADLFGLILPLQKAGGEFVPVNEKAAQPVIVSFLIPRDANSLNLLGGRHG